MLWSEGLFRTFNNRKQVAAYAGLAPTPWKSGSVHRDQGVSKAGNPRLRTTMIQMAWLWLRHQPQSALSLWFRERIKRTGGRLGKTMIVALARKLLVALWKYATAGVLIEGAVLKRRIALLPIFSRNLPGPDQSRRIQVDEPHLQPWPGKAEFEEGSRPPEPSPDASGMLVQPPRAATECEFELVPGPGQVVSGPRPRIWNDHRRSTETPDEKSVDT